MRTDMKTLNIALGWRAISILSVLILSLTGGCGGGGDGGPGPGPQPIPTPNVLGVPNAEGAPGATIQLVLTLENSVALSGLQFDLDVDPNILTITGAGAAARSTGFEGSVNMVGGTAHIMLVDLDGTASIGTGNGAVITVTADVSVTASGTSPLLVDHGSAVDINSTSLSLGGSSATFTVR
jgi:hypothetical protein